MKRKIDNKIFEAHFNRVLNRIAASVKSVIDECDDNVDECGLSEDDDDLMDGFDECDGDDCFESFDGMQHIDEMARTPKKRTIDPLLYKRVQASLAARRKAKQPLSTLQPNKGWSDEEVFNRYVSALLINGDPCPMTEEDVDKIETFAPYAHRFLNNGTYTIDDVIALYNAQDKHDISKKRGMKRGSVVLATEPSEDHDFDDDSKNANIPIQPTEVENNDVEDEVEETPAETTVDPLDSDFERNEYDNTPSYDNSDEDDDENVEDTEDVDDTVDDTVEDNVEDEDDDFADAEIEDLDDITYEVANDPRMNKAINNFNNRDFILDGKKIGHTFVIINRKTKDEDGRVTVWGDTFADVINKCRVIQDSEVSVPATQFKPERNPIFRKFMNKYFDVAEGHDDDDRIDNAVDDYVENFEDIETIDDYIAAYEKINDMKI